MTISNSGARVRFIGDGVSTLFHIFWSFVNVQHLIVTRRASGSEVEENLLLGTHYTLSQPVGPWPSGVFVIIPVGAKNAVGDIIAIWRNETIQQSADYQEGDAFPAETHEGALDYVTMLAARSKERLDRALTLRVTDPLAAGRFDGMNNRISNVLDPVDETDVATRGWVLSQISNPVGWTPDKNIAQWNADRLQGHPVQNVAPTDGYVLKWSATNGRWEPSVSFDATSLLASNNVWTGVNTYQGLTHFANDVYMDTSTKSLIFNNSFQRVKGLFYGTPHANRTLFTPNAAGQDCTIGVLPTAAGGSAGVGYYGNNDPDNASVLYIAAGPVSTLIQAAHTGAGAAQPIVFAIDATEIARFLVGGRLVLQRTVGANETQLEVNGLVSRDTGFVSAHRNAVAFNVNSAAWTKVDFTVEENDGKGWFDLVNDRFQPLLAGLYMISAGSGPEGAGVAGRRHQVAIYKNGAIYKTLGAPQFGGATDAMLASGCIPVFFNGSTDYVEVFVWQDTGGAVSFSGQTQDTFFMASHLG